MAKMPIDLSKFKKVRSDKHTTTLRHDEGHEITLAHGALSPKLRGQLASLKQADVKANKQAVPGKASLMAEGGRVKGPTKEDVALVDDIQDDELARTIMRESMNDEEDDKKPKHYNEGGGPPPADEPTPQASAPTPETPAPVTINIGAPGPQPSPQASAPTPPAEAPQTPGPIPTPTGPAFMPDPAAPAPQMQAAAPAPQAQMAAPQAPTAAPQMDPGAMSPKMPSGALESYQQQAAATQALANEEGKVATAQADLQRKAALQQEQAAATFQNSAKAIEDEYGAFLNDYKNQHIDPQHYMNSQGTDQKVTTAIGLILGGMGGAVTGQGNPALDFVNKQIDRDIDAQKAEMGKRENLLSANFKHFGNMRDATTMTQAMQLGIVATKMQEAALKSGDPIAQQRAQLAIAQLGTQIAPMIQQLQMRQFLMQNGTMGQDPAKFVPHVVDKEEQQAAYKEIQEAEENVHMANNLRTAFNEVEKLNSKEMALLSPVQRNARIAALIEPLVASVSKQKVGKYTEADATSIKALFSSLSNDPETVALKRAAMERFIRDKDSFPVMRAYNLDNSKFKSTSLDPVVQLSPVAQQQAAYAQQVLAHPKATEKQRQDATNALQRLGLK